MGSHHPAKFGGNGQCSGGDITVLVFHVITQSHVTKQSSNFMGRSPSKKVTILPSLAVISPVVVEI